MAVDVDLEVQMAADRAGVAGLPHRADPLARPDAVAAVDEGRVDHVGVEIAAPLALAVDQQVVAIEHGVIAGAQDPPRRRGEQRRVAGGDDVEAFVAAAAAARCPELADEAAGTVRSVDRENVVVEGDGAVGRLPRGGCGDNQQREKREKERALQWCSITRSTMLYSFASCALMK